MRASKSRNDIRKLMVESGFGTQQRYLDSQMDRFHASYDFLSRHLPATENAILIDAGSSDGILLPVLSAVGRYSDIHLLDCGEARDDEIALHLPTGELRAKLHNVNIEDDSFPFADSTVDIAVLSESLEHLRHDPMAALLELNRVLKPGGHLFLTTPNILASSTLSQWLRGMHPSASSAFWPRKMHFHSHAREYTADEVKLLLAAAGFDIAAFETHPRPGLKRRVEAFVLRLLAGCKPRADELGDTILCLARKKHHVDVRTLPAEKRYPFPVYETDRFQAAARQSE